MSCREHGMFLEFNPGFGSCPLCKAQALLNERDDEVVDLKQRVIDLKQEVSDLEAQISEHVNKL